MTRVFAVALVAVTAWAPAALAGGSMFRIIGADPHPQGAEVSVCMIQSGSADTVQVYVANAPQTDYYNPQGTCLGEMKLPSGMNKIVLDYGKTNLTPGQPLYMTMKWPGGHCWGLAGGEYARPSNTVQLPPAGACSGNNANAAASALKPQSVNVNTATLSQLLAIPSMDQARAEAIVAYRATAKLNDTFDLTKVPGVDKTQAALVAPFIKFTGETEVPAATSNSLLRGRRAWVPAVARVPAWRPLVRPGSRADRRTDGRR